jgi:hypothetical protein
VGLLCDMDRRLLAFFRNGEHIPGLLFRNLPGGEFYVATTLVSEAHPLASPPMPNLEPPCAETAVPELTQRGVLCRHEAGEPTHAHSMEPPKPSTSLQFHPRIMPPCVKPSATPFPPFLTCSSRPLPTPPGTLRFSRAPACASAPSPPRRFPPSTPSPVSPPAYARAPRGAPTAHLRKPARPSTPFPTPPLGVYSPAQLHAIHTQPRAIHTQPIHTQPIHTQPIHTQPLAARTHPLAQARILVLSSVRPSLHPSTTEHRTHPTPQHTASPRPTPPTIARQQLPVRSP